MLLISMIIKTASGSRYEIDDHGICRKFDIKGDLIDAFKVFKLKGVHKDVHNFSEAIEAPDCEPEVGMRLYAAGLDGWWLSTEIVEITSEVAWPPRRFRDASNGE
jgi:hypothetical protein